MTTYAWTEHHMIVAPMESGLENVIKRVIATYTADDGAGNTASQLMHVVLGAVDPENFTPYESLTLSQVIGWIEALVDTSYWQGYLDDILADAQLVHMECPWD